MKCLPATQQLLITNGTVLHDWHAETLVIRAFNRYLLQECCALVSSNDYHSSILERTEIEESFAKSRLRPFAIRPGLKIVMYVSEAPCGDASMELVMEAQDDATPWPVHVPDESPNVLLGRGSFSQLGIVRRKPGMF